ncbi:MAG: ion transporter [Cellvibrionaceae bacterium]
MALGTLKQKLNEIIFGTETPAGRAFDVVLIITILASVLVVMLDSMEVIANGHAKLIKIVEWVFTAIFTVEYITRIWVARHRKQYIFSFYGMVDLLSILPSYIALLYPDATYLLIIRLLRVLRVFRVLKLMRYIREANVLIKALLMSRRKILLFFSAVLVLSTIFGSLMYVVEGPANGFSSIPKSIYWTIVTITTVGYGDITPQSPIGQAIAAMAMLTGYSIIAVPTGIITSELLQEMQRERTEMQCGRCERVGHEKDAKHCKFCGEQLPI